jgi:prepilin-type processing-associated H-X9-DG protein
MCYKVNSTGQNVKINTFCCPSDPNAGQPDHNGFPNTNNYYGSIGTTTNLFNANTSIGTLSQPSNGIFTWQQSYGIRDVIDGTSNTIAFAECLVGNQSLQTGQKRIGMTGVSIPATSLLLDATGAPAIAAIAACDQAWNSRSYGLDRQRGENWAHGAQDMTLFNTIVPPNDKNDQWTNCSATGSGSMSNLSNSDSWHPGGVNVTMGDGSVKFIKDSVNRTTWWALGTRNGGEVISADQF